MVIMFVGTANADVPTMVSRKYVNDIVASLDNKFVKKTDIADSVNPNQEMPVTSKAVYSFISTPQNMREHIVNVFKYDTRRNLPEECKEPSAFCVYGYDRDEDAMVWRSM